MTKRILRSTFLAIFLSSLSTSAALAADAKQNWTKQCARCHGDDGVGNTKAGRKLHIKDLTLAKIQTRLTDDRIRESVADGIKNDEGEEQMPAFREKLSESERNELVGYVRSLANKAK